MEREGGDTVRLGTLWGAAPAQEPPGLAAVPIIVSHGKGERVGWAGGGGCSPWLRRTFPLLAASSMLLVSLESQALEVHNGLWKLNLWAGNGSREIEEQQNRACGPVTDASS